MVDEALRNFVTERAENRCEYCRLHQNEGRPYRFPVDRIIAGQHGGNYDPQNTALSCHECNEKKGPNIAGVDSDDGSIVTLFNPRTQVWFDHFDFRGPTIVGLTPTGRATVQTLGMNEEDRVLLRAELGYPQILQDEQ